jgi:hypothetical protein
LAITLGGPLLPLGVLFGLNAVDELDRTAFAVLLPDIRDQFGLSNAAALCLVHNVKVSGCAERVVNVLWRTERARLDELNESFPELAKALRALRDRVERRDERDAWRDGGLL